MTIALGIDFGNYILIAADIRTTFYNNFGRIEHFKDDSEKIMKTKMGLITGAGFLNPLDAVKLRLAKEEVYNSNELLIIFEEECSKYEIEQTNKTKWIFTFVQRKDNNFILRLASYDPNIGHKLSIVDERDKALIIFPYEASEKETQELFDLFNKKIKPFKEFQSLTKSVNYHAGIIGNLINLIQPLYQSISSFFQIGIYTLEGAGISQIINIENKSSFSIKLTFD